MTHINYNPIHLITLNRSTDFILNNRTITLDKLPEHFRKQWIDPALSGHLLRRKRPEPLQESLRMQYMELFDVIYLMHDNVIDRGMKSKYTSAYLTFQYLLNLSRVSHRVMTKNWMQKIKIFDITNYKTAVDLVSKSVSEG